VKTDRLPNKVLKGKKTCKKVNLSKTQETKGGAHVALTGKQQQSQNEEKTGQCSKA